MKQYIKDTVAEMKHVSWPSKRQTIWFTVLVVVISIVMSVYLGVLDAFFTKLLKIFIA